MELDKNFNLIIGLRIREIREAINMTRDEFSEMCDISASFLADVENGKKGFSTKTLYKICTATNISADYLIHGRENGFESDMLIEMLNIIPKRAKEAGIRMLREYVDIVNRLIQRSDDTKKK